MGQGYVSRCRLKPPENSTTTLGKYTTLHKGFFIDSSLGHSRVRLVLFGPLNRLLRRAKMPGDLGGENAPGDLGSGRGLLER